MGHFSFRLWRRQAVALWDSTGMDVDGGGAQISEGDSPTTFWYGLMPVIARSKRIQGVVSFLSCAARAFNRVLWSARLRA
jgi:hypothetical protein